MAVWQGDAELDKLYDSLFRELLTYMMEDARNITPCTHLLFIAKSIERIGDHATNIAELGLLPGARRAPHRSPAQRRIPRASRWSRPGQEEPG